MTAGFHHFVIEQGATFSKVLTLKDSSDSLIDLTGYSGAEMDLRRNADGSEVLTLTTGNSRITLGGSAGTVTLTISATDTASMTPDDGVYDLEITSGGGVVTRLLEGTYSVRPNISK